MQRPNWNDLRHLLAIKRARTLASAARRLGVDDTTVSRRLAALQTALKTQLVQRQGDGRMALTPAGEIVARHAEAIENQVQAIGDVVGSDQDPCLGTIRVTSVPIIVNRLLAGAAKAFLQAYPGLTIELIAIAVISA